MELDSRDVSGCSESEGGSVRGNKKKQKHDEENQTDGFQSRYQQWTKEVKSEAN